MALPVPSSGLTPRPRGPIGRCKLGQIAKMGERPGQMDFYGYVGDSPSCRNDLSGRNRAVAGRMVIWVSKWRAMRTTVASVTGVTLGAGGTSRPLVARWVASW